MGYYIVQKPANFEVLEPEWFVVCEVYKDNQNDEY